jgi:Leucine-rich repeat (LRR) protein
LNSLKLLDLTANRIKVIENVNHLKCLEDFWLGYNLLESFDSLSEFTDDIKLNAIYLEHNPVVLAVTAQVYCDTVKKYCPHINQIDADILGDINLDQR